MANEIITSHEELVKLVKDGCMRVGNGCILRTRLGEVGDLEAQSFNFSKNFKQKYK